MRLRPPISTLFPYTTLFRSEYVSGRTFEVQDRLNLWERLREEIGRHRQFSEADWSMDDDTLRRLEAIAEELEPRETTERFGYLFDWHPSLPHRSEERR